MAAAAVRVVIVDDSEIVRARLETILEEGPDLRVVRKLSTLQGVDLDRAFSGADVALVDLLMPGRSGILVLTDLAARVPVVIVSDEMEDSHLRREAMARGARAFVSKRELAFPKGQERLRAVVREAALKADAPGKAPLLIVAGSTGAHRALERLAPSIAAGGWRALVLQHLTEKGDAPFARWLSELGLPAELASEGRVVDTSCALVAPSGQQIRLDTAGRVRLSGPGGELHAPSADVLLESAAAHAPNVTAVILSGLGRDGSRGAAALARAGGRVIVQAPEECVASSMPTHARSAVPDAPALSLVALARELGRGKRR